jgi:CRP-like cAMP-binding protein
MRLHFKTVDLSQDATQSADQTSQYCKRGKHLGQAMTPTPNDLKIASQIAVFSGLNPRTVQTLLARATVVALESGHTLFRQGELATAFFIVIEGWIKLYRVTPAGDEAVLNVFTKGGSFAEAVALTSGHHPVAASAATDARIIQIPAHHVVCCIREMPDIAIAMIASTSQHLHRLVQRIEQLTAQSALQRVAEFLVSLCPCMDGPCTISLPYDKSLIAGRLGLQPESLSRAFAKLRSVGVNVRTSDVVVSDVARLRGVIASDRIGARGMSFESRVNGGRSGGSH